MKIAYINVLLATKMKTKAIVTILAILGITYFSKAQDDLKIQATSKGGIYAFGFFSGQLTFNTGDFIGDKYSSNEGYFLAKFDSLGNTKWVKHIKTMSLFCEGLCPGIGLCTDNSDNIYITADFRDTIEFDSTNLMVNSIGVETFIAKYNSEGNFVWAQKPITSNGSQGVDIDTDSSGNVYVTGIYTKGSLTFDSLTPLYDSSYDANIFIVKFDSGGNGLWLKQLHGGSVGNGSSHEVYSITTDNIGNSYIVGYFGGTFGGTLYFGNLSILSSGTDFEIFVAKCDPIGNPVWLKKVNGLAGTDFPEQIAVDDSSDLYFTGFFDLTAKFGSLPTLTAATRDIFITHFDSSGNAQWVRQASPNNSNYGNESKGIAVDQAGNIFTIGYFTDSVEFPPLSPISIISGNGFLVKHDKLGSALCINNAQLDFEDISIDPNGNIYTISGDAGMFGGNNVTISKWGNNCDHLWDKTITHDYNGIEESQYLVTANVFPNPTSGIITIEIIGPIKQRATMEVYNLSGQLIIKEELNHGKQTLQLDLTKSNHVVYFFANQNGKRSSG